MKQPTELDAVRAMISTSPDRFWALAESLLDSGFLPTENVIVLEGKDDVLSVREGNRRVAALKLIHGLIPLTDLPVLPEIEQRIAALSPDWLRDNTNIPCVVYAPSEANIVARIVRLAHGKGEKAGRDQWNAVARSRHNRDENGASEPALDLLEKYIDAGRNVTDAQASRWAGDYPLTVLEDAMKRLAPRLGLKAAPAVASTYPSIRQREAVERVIHDIGSKQLTFPILRGPDSLFRLYGIGSPEHDEPPDPGDGSSRGAGGGASGKSGKTARGKQSSTKAKAIPINDLRSVKRALMRFAPVGDNRDKLAALAEEASKLKVDDTPMAFCFLLRSMFELSARAYVDDHRSTGGPTLKKSDGKDKPLGKLLGEIARHMVGTGAAKDKAKEKELHGASMELASQHGVLSVTSLNQLVHSQSFSVAPHSIAIMFSNIFPLLEAMSS